MTRLRRSERPKIAGTMVNPKGMTKKVTASVAGGVVGGRGRHLRGGHGHRRCIRRGARGAELRPRRLLAASADAVALVKTKSGAFKMKVTDESLATVPRSEIASAELDQGKLLSQLTIVFNNGVTWEFDIPKAAKKTAQGLVTALGGTLS